MRSVYLRLRSKTKVLIKIVVGDGVLAYNTSLSTCYIVVTTQYGHMLLLSSDNYYYTLPQLCGIVVSAYGKLILTIVKWIV